MLFWIFGGGNYIIFSWCMCGTYIKVIGVSKSYVLVWYQFSSIQISTFKIIDIPLRGKNSTVKPRRAIFILFISQGVNKKGWNDPLKKLITSRFTTNCRFSAFIRTTFLNRAYYECNLVQKSSLYNFSYFIWCCPLKLSHHFNHQRSHRSKYLLRSSSKSSLLSWLIDFFFLLNIFFSFLFFELTTAHHRRPNSFQVLFFWLFQSHSKAVSSASPLVPTMMLGGGNWSYVRNMSSGTTCACTESIEKVSIAFFLFFFFHCVYWLFWCQVKGNSGVSLCNFKTWFQSGRL